MTEHAHLTEHRLHSEQVYRGHFLQIMRDSVQLPNHKESVREYVLHPGAVMIIPLLGEGADLRVVLERQYRYPLAQAVLEFPAGKLDARETSLQCARRELREETGYQAREWARAGRLHPAIAYSNEFIDIWFARGLVAGERALDDGEFLDVLSATPAELLQCCASGEITDGKTLTGALWLQNVLSGAWSLDWETPAD